MPFRIFILLATTQHYARCNRKRKWIPKKNYIGVTRRWEPRQFAQSYCVCGIRVYADAMESKLSWIDYLDRLPGKPRDNQIAQSARIAPSTVSRWRGGQDPRPMHAVMVARSHGLHPFGALSAAGYLSDAEMASVLDGIPIAELVSLDDFSTSTLANEVARRVSKLED